MLVRHFLSWTETAPADKRAAGASALARAYIGAELPPGEAGEAVVALTSLLDDPSPLVRRALAEALAGSAAAPPHVIAALTADQSDIASVVLARSPLLADADLIDSAAIGDVFAQSAIAIRPGLSAPVAAALAEVGSREALIALAVNLSADIPDFALRRIIERCGSDGELREALLARPRLPAVIRHDLVVAAAAALSAFVTGCGWLSEVRARRVVSEACERGVVTLSAAAGLAATRALVRHLRTSCALTAGLMLRSVLSGNVGLCEAALVELSGLAPLRVIGLVRESGGSGFAALYKKAGLPAALLPVFRAALAAARDCGARLDSGAGRLSRDIVERVLQASAAFDTGSHRLLGLLHRFAAEAAREEARALAADMVQTARGERELGLRRSLPASRSEMAQAVRAAAVPGVEPHDPAIRAAA